MKPARFCDSCGVRKMSVQRYRDRALLGELISRGHDRLAARRTVDLCGECHRDLAATVGFRKPSGREF